jgi:uncharacterized DUF497 family protein
MEYEEFEWDEAKRAANLVKHGFDFTDAVELFGNPHLAGPARSVDGEERWLAVGLIEDDYAAAIYTRRGRVIRLIVRRRMLWDS